LLNPYLRIVIFSSGFKVLKMLNRSGVASISSSAWALIGIRQDLSRLALALEADSYTEIVSKIFCRWSLEVANKVVSSAKACTGDKWRGMLFSSLAIVARNGSIARAKRIGEMGSPCLTPLSSRNCFEKVLLSVIAAFCLKMIAAMIHIKSGGRLKALSTCIR
jgi:hypothetical protein